MYIRTTDGALDALEEVLDVAGRRNQLIESTVRLMLCLDPAARSLLLDGQSLLVSGGLAGLRQRRRPWLASLDTLPLILMDPEERAALEELAADFDALRFADLVRHVFPGFRTERWRIARVLSREEASVREAVAEGLRSRKDPIRTRKCQGILRALVARHTPEWIDRAGTIWAACHDGLRTCPQPPDPDQFHPEVERLFELTAVSDARAAELLAAVGQDSSESCRWVHQLEALALAVRSLPPEPPQTPEGGSARNIA